MLFPDRPSVMRRACELALGGQGFVEPNPLVGAVLVDDDLRLIGEGFHRQFGGPHAEIEALRDAEARGHHERLPSATLFVTLEPCCHFGKTPPCTQALRAAGIRKVVIGRVDPANHANGQGISELRGAGVEVAVGLLEAETKCLVAPFAKRTITGLPWVIAKWAMTWDGKLATITGDSQWISNPASRAIAHGLRGRVDAILVGAGTVRRDDPLLTARPPGPRMATRVVLDSQASLSLNSQLVRTRADAPLLVIAGPSAPTENIARLQAAGVDVCLLPAADISDTHQASRPDVRAILQELGRRGMTNVLVEGGAAVLGELADRDLIDEVRVFIGPKLFGGANAPGPLAGQGRIEVSSALRLENVHIEALNGDASLSGIISGHVL